MATHYTITFKNCSRNAGSFCLFQKMPEKTPGLVSLAWFSKFSCPKTTLQFQWEIRYGAVWGENRSLMPGQCFFLSQYFPVELNGNDGNSVLFSFTEGAYQLQKSVKPTPENAIGIYMDKNVPFDAAAVGIGMAGKGVFAMMAQPNWNFIFTPQPMYYAVFGSFTEGQVLDLSLMGSSVMSNEVRIDFPANVYDKSLVLNQRNEWEDLNA